MLYARINLSKTNYELKPDGWGFIGTPDIPAFNKLYYEYCKYKRFKSVMPIFDTEYLSEHNDLIAYTHENKMVAFSLLTRYDNKNVEAVQFAWDYKQPELSLGIESLKHECALYKLKGYEYMYLGGADDYKSQIDGFEICPPA